VFRVINVVCAIVRSKYIGWKCNIAPSPTNPREEGIAEAPGNDGNASMPEQVKRPNPWRKMMMSITYEGKQ